MLRKNKEGKLVELSLKQRDQWFAYHYDADMRSWPKLSSIRPGTPAPWSQTSSTAKVKPSAKNM